jgi:dolichol-phosphate mannosyltransferase
MDILFDLDGTLLDVSRRHYSVYSDILTEWNRSPLPFAQYWALKRDKTPLSVILAKSGAEDLTESFGPVWLERIERHDYLEKDSLVAHGRELLDLLRKRHRLFLVTLRHSLKASAEQLRRLSLDDAFQAVLIAGDPEAGGSCKADLIGTRLPEATGWLVGDTEADVEAARAIGLQSCSVTWGLRSPNFLHALQPDAIVEDVMAIFDIVGDSQTRRKSLAHEQVKTLPRDEISSPQVQGDGSDIPATPTREVCLKWMGTVSAQATNNLTFGVIVPVYNEQRLALVLERIDFNVIPHVIVVDDGSDDGSVAVAREYPVTLLKHERRTGVGAGIRTGLVHLKNRGIDVAVTMAGNNKDDPSEIPALIREIKNGADYVQGSRYLVPNGAKGTPLSRRIITRAVAYLWSARFTRKLTDVTNGLRAYRLSLLDDPRIDLSQEWLNRYELEYYLHYKILSLDYRYVEVPASKRYPTDGMSTSKIRLVRDYWSLLRPLVLLTLHLRN